MMKDILRMQKKIIRGLSANEKKEMTDNINGMIESIEKMISETRGMMMHRMSEEPSAPPTVNPPTDAPKKDPHGH
ncbi:MAG: hypothetical protein AB1552_13705 [Nitrospirota bacterium]